MINLTRRTMLAGAAATLCTPTSLSLVSSARALAPTGQQGPSFYRYKVGGFECTSLSDGARSFPLPDSFVVNVPKEQVAAAAEAAYMPKGMVTVPFNPQVINTGSKLVLIDTGNGVIPNAPVGRLIPNMIAAGIDPKAIDIVLLSHLHPDHANGIRTADNGMAFPNAEILLPAKEWAFWMSDENMAKATTDLMKNYFANTRKVFAGLADRVTKYEWGKEVAPGITSIDANGHTPGHTAFVVASGNSRVLVQSDVTNIPEFFLRNPDWHVAYDVDPQQAQLTRHKFYDMAAAEKALVIGFHFAFPSMGHVEKNGAGYRLVPIAWNPVL